MRKKQMFYLLLCQLIMASDARKCIRGRPFSQYEIFRGSLPGIDENGECFILSCKQDLCSTWNSGNPTCTKCPDNKCLPSHAIEISECQNCDSLEVSEVSHNGLTMNIPFQEEQRGHCNYYNSGKIRKKNVIRSPKESYCTFSEICAYEPIIVRAHVYETKVAKICHKVPQALASHTQQFFIQGNTFNETITCSFDICDVTSLLDFAYWHGFCLSSLELTIISLFALTIVSLISFTLVKCVGRKAEHRDAKNNAKPKMDIEIAINENK